VAAAFNVGARLARTCVCDASLLRPTDIGVGRETQPKQGTVGMASKIQDERCSANDGEARTPQNTNGKSQPNRIDN